MSLEEFEGQFEQLDKAINDPVVTAVIDEAKLFNELLTQEATTVEDIKPMVLELESKWQRMMGSPVKVTGFVDMMNEAGVVESTFCDERDFISNGFCVANGDDGEVVGRKIMLELLKPVSKDPKDNTFVVCKGDIDRTNVQFQTASFERASAWLTALYPEVIDELDGRLFANDGSEADAVMALKGMELPLFGGDKDFAFHCITNYLHEVIQFDTTLPYEIKIEGEVVMTDDEGFERIYEIRSDNLLAQINNVLPGQRHSLEGISGFLSLDISLASKDRLAPNIPMKVPIDSIVSLESVRSVYYS